MDGFRRTGAVPNRGGAECFSGSHPCIRPTITIGIALIGIGILVTVTAAIRHHRYIQAIDRSRFQQEFGVGFGIGVAVLLALLGLIMALYLLVL